jgi:hypothetical protein
MLRMKHIFAIPCADEDRAKKFSEYLHNQEVDVDHIDGKAVYIPTSYPPFALDIAQVAVDKDFGNDHEVCESVNQFFVDLGL